MEQRELDGIRLLRQVPAITELSLLDDQGREQLRMSRQAMDRVGGNFDFSADDKFKTAVANKVYYGPVNFRHGSEPFMTLSVAGARREAGVSVAEVNLTHIWDVVNQIHVGRSGRAYVVGGQGRLIAHPDISLVLRNTDLSGLAQVRCGAAGDRVPRRRASADRARRARRTRADRVCQSDPARLAGIRGDSRKRGRRAALCRDHAFRGHPVGRPRAGAARGVACSRA